MFDFGGERVVITGAGGGVGRALVEVFCAANASVVACDRADADLSDLPVAEAHRFDLLDDGAMDEAASAICRKGAPRAVVSNAGWTRAETLDDVTTEALDRELDINLRAATRLTLKFLPSMRARGGAFVFVASINALAHYGNPAYSAAKAGLVAWMRAVATEEGRHGIRANAIAPGSIRTAAWDHRIAKDPAVVDRVSRFYPLGRMVAPQEVAQAVAFLASPLASGITGVTLPVDAGVSGGNLPFIREISP